MHPAGTRRHWPLEIAFRWSSVGFEDVGIKLLVIVISIALAAFTYEVVEKVFRDWRPKYNHLVFLTLLPVTGLVAGLPREDCGALHTACVYIPHMLCNQQPYRARRWHTDDSL